MAKAEIECLQCDYAKTFKLSYKAKDAAADHVRGTGHSIVVECQHDPRVISEISVYAVHSAKMVWWTEDVEESEGVERRRAIISVVTKDRATLTKG